MTDVKKFAVFDIDGTLFRWQLYHELFDALIDEKLVQPNDAKSVVDARESWRNRTSDYHDYEQMLITAMQRAIVGINEQKFNEIADSILKTKGQHVYRYTLDLLKTLKADGYTIIAISGSHQQLVDRFALLHNIDIAVGREHVIEHGKLTSRASEVFNRKNEILTQLVEKHGLDWTGSYAVGDSGGDIAMLSIVENPIAFNPNEDLKNEAMKHGWPIVIERKSIAYRLEKGTDGTYVLA